MNKFELAIQHVLKYEGGYVNNPNDKGGETKYGISKRSYPDLDIKNLTKQDAKDIYKRDFWDTQLYEDIVYFSVAKKIFDLHINMGKHTAHQIAQRALNNIDKSLKEDGDLGQKTLSAINKSNPRELIANIMVTAGRYYRDIVKNDITQKIFLKGWLRRTYDN